MSSPNAPDFVQLAGPNAGVGLRPYITAPVVIPNTAGTYAANGIVMGGLVGLDLGLGAGVLVTPSIRFALPYDVGITTATGFFAVPFLAQPTASTVVNNAVLAVAAADYPKVFASAAVSWATSAVGGALTAAFAMPRVATDANGKIWFALATGTVAIAYPNANVITVHADGQY